MFYDALLLISVLLLATALALLLTRGSLDYNNPFFRSYLFLIWFVFYAWFWTHGGQTLGMQAWKLRLQRADGGPVTPWQALLRFLAAFPSLLLFGLGMLWMLVDRDRMTWHDRFSESVIVRLPKG
jgi:uncharacterized RDD family membrane protein YckC